MARTHFTFSHAYRPGTTSRTGYPRSGVSSRPSRRVASKVSSAAKSAIRRLALYPKSAHTMTCVTSAAGGTACSSAAVGTPSQATPGKLSFVTHESPLPPAAPAAQ